MDTTEQISARTQSTMSKRNENHHFPSSIHNFKIYAVLCMFRILNSLLIRTQFDPDEYWQTLEPAYCLVFSSSSNSNSCDYTWEWTRSIDATDYVIDDKNGSFIVDLIVRALHGPIRSYVAVLPTAMFYTVISFIAASAANGHNNGSEHALSAAGEAILPCMNFLVRKGPALVHSVLFAAPTDFSVYYIARYLFRENDDVEAIAWYALLASVTSWFNGYALVRTYANSIECAICAVATCLLCPELFGRRDIDGNVAETRPVAILAFVMGGISVAIRFSAVAYWIPVGVIVCLRSKCVSRSFCLYFLSGVAGIILSCVVDSALYGFIVIPFLGSFHFNVLLGNSSLYGTHPSYWYFLGGFPAICGAMLPLVLLILKKTCFSPKGSFITEARCKEGLSRLIYVIIFYITMHSFSAHKEFRFILPILPLVCVLAGGAIHHISIINGEKNRRRNVIITIVFMVILNWPHLIFLATIHQRAPIAVTEYLSERIKAKSIPVVLDGGSGTGITNKQIFSVHFLMGCHSTPVFSHLHIPFVDIEIWSLDCSPLCRQDLLFPCESENFERNPLQFIKDTYVAEGEVTEDESVCSINCKPLPDFIAIYDNNEVILDDFLSGIGKEIARFPQSVKGFKIDTDTSIPISLQYDEMILFEINS